MAAKSPRPETRQSYRPGNARSSQAQRRRIHDAKNAAALHFGARHRALYKVSFIAWMMTVLAHHVR